MFFLEMDLYFIFSKTCGISPCSSGFQGNLDDLDLDDMDSDISGLCLSEDGLMSNLHLHSLQYKVKRYPDPDYLGRSSLYFGPGVIRKPIGMTKQNATFDT